MTEESGETKRRSMKDKYRPLSPNKKIPNMSIDSRNKSGLPARHCTYKPPPLPPIIEEKKPQLGKFGVILPPAKTSKKFTIISGIYGRKREQGKSVIYTIMGKRTLLRRRRIRHAEKYISAIVAAIVMAVAIITLFVVYIIIFGEGLENGNVKQTGKHIEGIFGD